jgi:predicted nucleic acid-binding protein
MNGTVFVDTNLLVYRRDRSEREKQPRAEAWMAFLWNERAGRLSMQVINEYYVTVTQKLKPGLKRGSARDEIRSLLAWRPVPTDLQTLEGAWRIQDRYRLSFWDSLIVSAALVADCRYLLTEDLQEGQVFDSLRVVNPFTQRPEDLP